jgi:hypothetical protein
MSEIITAAIEGFEAQKARLDAQISELRATLSGEPVTPAATPKGPKLKRRKMSAAARARMAEAQRKRWAAVRKASAPSIPEAAPKPKRKLSADGRKAIIAALKKRWAAKRAAASS